VLGYVATTEGIEREDLQNLTITAVRYRFWARETAAADDQVAIG
jgi:hypothetical protein